MSDAAYLVTWPKGLAAIKQFGSQSMQSFNAFFKEFKPISAFLIKAGSNIRSVRFSGVKKIIESIERQKQLNVYSLSLSLVFLLCFSLPYFAVPFTFCFDPAS